MLHIVNGDATRVPLEQANVPGEIAVWADALYDGPVPPLRTGDELWRSLRTAHWHGGQTPTEWPSKLDIWDAAVARWPEHDEVVIWCEHDLFDQLLLMRHLAWFSDKSLGTTRLSMICIDAFPGHPHFLGIGELNAEELASLFPQRRPITREQLSLGKRAFDAFTALEPHELVAIAFDVETSALPFLAPAYRRLLGEFPAVKTGLTVTESEILEFVRDAGRPTMAELIRELHRIDRAFTMTDTTLRQTLARLASEPALVRLGPGVSDEWARTVSITTLGETVLDGDQDMLTLQGIDRWIGGIELNDTMPDWRRDPATGRLVLA